MGFTKYNQKFGENKSKRDELLKDYKLHLQEKGEKPRTIDSHVKNVYRIITHTGSFTKEEIDKYFSSLAEKGRKNSYINDLISSIRVYSRFKGYGEELVHFKYRKESPSNVSTLSDDEIEALVNMPVPVVPQRHRSGKMMMRRSCPESIWNTWSMFFKIMAFTGMRPGEVAFLRVRNVDFGRSVFVIEDTKTNTYLNRMKNFELAPIPPNIEKEVKAFIDDRNLGVDDYLFPSRYGGNKDGITPVVDNVDWYTAFHRRLKLLNIKRPGLRPYSLRHSFATSLLETEGVDIVDTMKLMRHKDIKTTLIYEHLTTKDLINTVKKLPLVRKGSDPKNILKLLITAIRSFQIDRDDRFEFSIEEKGDSVDFHAKIVRSEV